MRLGNFFIAFVSVLALVAGSAVFGGLLYWLFTAIVVGAAGTLTYVLFARRTRKWLAQTYRLINTGRVAAFRDEVEAELKRPASPIRRQVLELMRAEALFWLGDFAGARAAVKQIDLKKLAPAWEGAVRGLIVTSSAFGGQVEEAQQTLVDHRALLQERPGYHQLEALAAVRAGDFVKARERWNSPAPDEAEWERPPVVRAALALVQAEIALGFGEPADAFIAEAVALGGDSFIPARAKALPA